MKIACLFFFIFTAIIQPVTAQIETSDTFLFSTQSNDKSYISLEMDKTPVSFDFNSMDDYKNGVGARSPIRTSASVDGNIAWKVDFSASRELTSQDGIHTIKLDNVGLSVDIIKSNGLILSVPTEPQKLAQLQRTLFSARKPVNGRVKVEFDLLWEMGTRRGTMNQVDLLEQNLTGGTYSTNVTFVVTEGL